MILWSKFDTFRRDESFVRWACGVARLQILRFFRKQRRKLLPMDEATIELLLNERTEREDDLADRRVALAECIQQLRSKDRTLLETCYSPGTSFKEAAEELGRPVGALYHSLARIRRWLYGCVNRKTAMEGGQ